MCSWSSVRFFFAQALLLSSTSSVWIAVESFLMSLTRRLSFSQPRSGLSSSKSQYMMIISVPTLRHCHSPFNVHSSGAVINPSTSIVCSGGVSSSSSSTSLSSGRIVPARWALIFLTACSSLKARWTSFLLRYRNCCRVFLMLRSASATACASVRSGVCWNWPSRAS